MRFLSGVLKAVSDFVLPPRCPICGVIVDADNRFCLPCWQNLDFLNEPWCASCGRPFAFAQGEGAQCVSCLKKKPNHDGVRAVVGYDEKSSLLPLRLKYGARLGVAELIGRHMLRFLDEIPSDALIIPVPLHRWRLWSRGFNQSVLIGKALSRQSGLAIKGEILTRKKATPPLRHMSAKQRRAVVNKVFEISIDAKPQLSGKTIILVDDVYTTGATADACAKLLKQSGAEKVLVFCWSRVLTGYDQS